MCASWILGSWLLEYIYVLLSLGPFMFGMPNITTIIPSPAPVPSEYLGVGLGGTTTPYLAHKFGSGHIPSSTPFAEDFHSLRPILTLVFIHMGGWWICERWVYTLHSFLCPIVQCIVSFECSFHDQSSLYPIVWTLY